MKILIETQYSFRKVNHVYGVDKGESANSVYLNNITDAQVISE